jgi:hypothetical protein
MSTSTKRKVTLYVDEAGLRAARVRAARTDARDSQVVEDALRAYLGFDVVERVWARSDLGEAEALRGGDGDSAVREQRGAARRLDTNVLSRADHPRAMPSSPGRRLRGRRRHAWPSCARCRPREVRGNVTVAEADAHVEHIRQSIVVNDPGPSTQPAVADPDDAYLVDLSMAASVDVLVSGDKRLLDLRSEVRVMTPAEFLASIGDA